MLLGIGVTDTNLQLILNIVYSAVSWVFATSGARLHDVVGRRKMLLGATAGMIICLAIIAACSAAFVEYDNKVSPTVSIVFIFVFGSIFACGYTPMQPIYPAEVVSNRMRAKAMGTYKLTTGAAGFLNTFVGPIALSDVSLPSQPHGVLSSLMVDADWVLVLCLLRVLGHLRVRIHILSLCRDQGPHAGGARRHI